MSIPPLRDIINTLAKERGLVTPVPDHFALSPEFCEACMERLLEIVESQRKTK